MAKIVLTQRLKVSGRAFQDITRAIMLHSNAERKLKGLGQCVAAWLEMWKTGELALQPFDNWQEIVEHDVAYDHVIYLSFSGTTSNLLRAWKEALQARIGRRVTISESILALTELFLHRSD